MRCEFCGGKLTLEDEVCPYCGRENEDAKQHIQAMKQYEQEFHATRRDVYTATKTYSEVVVRLIILAVLVILLVGVAVVNHNIYSIHRGIAVKKAEASFAQYSQIMDDYIEQHDYLGLNDFCEEKYIRPYNDTYGGYSTIIRAADSYRWFCESVMGYVCNSTSVDPERDIQSISDNLDIFYRNCMVKESSYGDRQDKADTPEIIADMKAQASAILQVYCHVTKEEADSMETMTAAKRTVLLEERLMGDE